MDTLWAPWRMEYIRSEAPGGCVFCQAVDNTEGLTLFSGSLTMVVMNKFPYINGHLLVAPKRHVAALEDLSREEMAALMVMVKRSVGVLRDEMAPGGFNVGLNLGRVAGAGIEDHLHFHIVPRWQGDVNALTVFGDVRVVPEHLEETCRRLKVHFDRFSETE